MPYLTSHQIKVVIRAAKIGATHWSKHGSDIPTLNLAITKLEQEADRIDQKNLRRNLEKTNGK